MRLTSALRDAALRWIADDPDSATRAELQRILATAMVGDESVVVELAGRMTGGLRFGTAGPRGPVRAGPAGMNVAVVARVTAGLAGWLARDGARGTVVVGRDARHGSAAFARATTQVLAGAGFAVRVLSGAVPTPLLAFAVRELGAVAGVQITASHNPPADNGYKVYLADGAQLAPPADAEIEARIAVAPAAVALPTADFAAGTTLVDGTEVEVTQAYLDRVARLPRGAARALRLALTPLHGVGGATAVHALAGAGFTDVHVVTAQAVPDPDFPTVAFPNPEEPGATDALLALAAEVGADLAVAFDPNADRCALGVPLPGGGWRMLTGDETGVLLGDHLLYAGGARGIAYCDPLVATTVVSSSMLRSIAAAYGARYTETLTGFKWIARGGPGLVYGYEEALGYCVDPDAVRDKDGIAAAVLAADLAAGLRTGPRPARPARRARDRARGAPHARHLGAARPGRPGRGAGAAADDATGRLASRPTRPRRRRAAPRGRAAGRAALGHRAEAQGLPAGGRAGAGPGRAVHRAGHRRGSTCRTAGGGTRHF